MSEEVEKIVETCVQDVYLSSENTPLTECYQELVKRIIQENEHRHKNNKLKLVSYAQLRRYVLGIDAYEVHASRFGRASAEKKFKISRKTRRRLSRALERVEIDHTPCDVFVVDDKGETLGRAYLYKCMTLFKQICLLMQVEYVLMKTAQADARQLLQISEGED